jgi:hypothetical protein
MKKTELALGILILAASSTAQAHLKVLSHTARHTQSDQKTGPCGKANSQRGTKVYTYAPGETIPVEIDEYIAHPGYFRISFDEEGQDDFVSPKTIDPPSLMDNDAVLMDGLDMHESGGGKRSYKVKLPDVECSKCTLQIIQVMLDKPPYDPQDNGAFSNDIYYACLDIELKRSGGSTSQGDAAVPSDAATQAPARDGGFVDAAGPDDEEEPPDTEPPPAAARDAGRAASKVDAGASRDTQRRDAGTASAGESGDDEADHDPSEHDEEESDESEDHASAAPEAEDGCSVGGTRGARDAALSLGLLFSMLTLSNVRRRRRN